MRKVLLFALTLASLASAQRTVPLEPWETLEDGSYGVVRSIDGDTLVVLAPPPLATSGGAMSGGSSALVPRSIRVIGLDTPELHPPAPYAEEAAEFTAGEAMPGTTVTLTGEAERVDRYGRALMHVTTTRGQSLAELLLQAGLAVADPVAPNTTYRDRYAAIELGAASVGKGLHRVPGWRFADADCSDFDTLDDAIWFYFGATTERARDPHRLDGSDRDGVPCNGRGSPLVRSTRN